MSSSPLTRHSLLESWLELNQVIEQHPEIRGLLFDPVTGLPTTPLLFPRIRVLLEERGEVSLLCLNVVRYSKIEEIYGWKAFDEVMFKIAETLEGIAGTDLRDSDIVAELMISGNAFVIVLSPPRDSDRMDPDALEALVRRIETRLREELAKRIEPSLFKKFGCYAGAATMGHDANARLERLVHEGLDRALSESYGREAVDAEERKRRLRAIIDSEQISTLVHPVIDLADMSVVGYEALSRGPEGGEFERPDKLFDAAYDADLVFRLERLCRKKALQAARTMPDRRLMFINIEPEAVADPELRDVMFGSVLSEAGLDPQQIVLEITERTAIDDFRTFRATLEHLRAMGFAVAVDDAGAGYGSLQVLAEVRPEWLKIDMSLVRGVDTDEVRSHLVESIVMFAQRIGVKLVAEGIETEGELRRIRELGVGYAQGFLFAKPSPTFPADLDLSHLEG
ncbi:MAG: hypothetical protein C0418_01110 [Coriobacteriaceae bacterium]|nr:hypothetical protein [Coriobacteriaceae bacterium]